ncbi:hypothetical protein K1T71_003749 [Dendrolimus kikuchii]|uniref:Uncharacterized protein n=1 Tax=Dendrolimus kikuchii TaxID=765133 RepID=A0ACC1D900_9NEOP|nr:hypothetical protein K1T71_003749 [Dendrolimus kikuchii]
MKCKSIFCDGFYFLNRHIFKILWISLVLYLFYDTFIYYKYGQEFYYLRRILGLGLCVSRGTATVLNLCAALILFPICKKLNQILYALLSKVWPGLFFFWIENAKSIHMTVAITLSLFAVLHSISHFVNLWNFSRGYDEECPEINFANYRNESPFMLLLSMAGLTGLTMLIILLSMSLTSMRFIRRKVYNAFWYTHQLYVPFVVLLIIHPLSGVLKKQILESDASLHPSQIKNGSSLFRMTEIEPKFAPIESRAWLWMLLPLTCYFMDLLWRICTRNRARVEILDATLMPGRTISLRLSCPHDRFVCRPGQYVLLQCLDVSLIEWHPFTVVKVPTSYQRDFTVWIRVKGDWTEALDNLLIERGPNKLSILVDGPFSSPMEGASGSKVAICIAAGVGITPFVPLLHDMLLNPRSRSPGRVHLIWIVRHKQEVVWLAALANTTIGELRNANRPDRLQLELYLTSSKEGLEKEFSYTVVMDEKGELSHILSKENRSQKVILMNRKADSNCTRIRNSVNEFENFGILSPSLNRNISKMQNYKNYSEMVPLLTSNLKINNSSIKDNDDSVDRLTPNLNRNNSRILCADDADERVTLLTPNLKRNNSKGKQLNPKLPSYGYNNKVVNLNQKFNHDNYENAMILTPKVDKTMYRQNSKNSHNEEVISNLIKDISDYTPKNINKSINISASAISPYIKYDDDGTYNRNNYMNNYLFQTNTCMENVNIDTRLQDNRTLYKVLSREDNNAIKNNLQMKHDEKEFDIAKEFPLLACRLRKGRPHWDRAFGYWVHLYPGDHLNLYCCGPKKLVKLLKMKCKEYSRDTKTTFAFVHEGFS